MLGCSPSSLLFDVAERDGSPPIQIGTVQLKCDVSKMQAVVYTPESQSPKLIVRAANCECKKCCPQSKKPMDELEFEIYDFRVDSVTGKATKVFTDYCQEYFSGGWHWVLDFPYNCSYQTKTLLIEAVHLIDMAFFDRPRICCNLCC